MTKRAQAAVEAAEFDIPQTAEVEAEAPLEPNAQVIIRGRNLEVPKHFSQRIKTKLARIERLDPRIIQFEVELSHENNPRLSKIRDRVEITARGKGAPVRGESSEDSFYAALEAALRKLERSLRKVKARRTIARSGHRTPKSVSEVTAVFEEQNNHAAQAEASADAYEDSVEDILPGRIVRRKVHEAQPMSVDEALYEMELVGHDFFLFHDLETDLPTVVYRRRAFDYGLIVLGEEIDEKK